MPGGDALALFAVGGYGRGELFPQSDIDLLVLAEPDAQRRSSPAWRVLRPALGCRPAGQPCRAFAANAPSAASRPDRAHRADRSAPAGRRGAARGLRATIAPDRACGRRARSSEPSVEEQRQRHARFGDTSDNLEPNIKDGPGGLRDLHMLGWMALRSFGVRELDALVGLGHLGADEAIALERERRALAACAYGLHLVAGGAKNACASTTRSCWPRAWATKTTATRSRSRR
jgi:[protein-PII] uridylyltransferase